MGYERSCSLANYLHATLTALAYNRVGWGGRWGVGRAIDVHVHMHTIFMLRYQDLLL